MKTIEHVDEDGWRKPVLINDWGSEAYFLKAIMSDAGTWGHSEQDQTQRLKTGDRLEVRWPNNRVTVETLKSVKCHSSVSDMGHEYPVSYDQVYIETEVNGHKVTITNLKDLSVKRA